MSDSPNIVQGSTPQLRVLTSHYQHPYHRALYDRLSPRIIDAPIPAWAWDDSAILDAILLGVDQFHLHWPEWFLGPDIVHHQRFIESLRRAEVRIVWTQHNLLPHAGGSEWAAIYQAWAEAADAVIHHSHWGMARALNTYRYSPQTRHRVIPHGHWAPLLADSANVDRAEVESELGLTSGRLHLGIVGAPRPAKDIRLAVDAFVASGRDDLDLLILSLAADDPMPDHPRIRAYRYENVPRSVYNRRLAVIDVFVLPFAADGTMLTTGLVGDVVGLGRSALVSDWPYLTEVLADAAICYGRSVDDLAACLRSLTSDQLIAAASASQSLQAVYAWDTIAEQTSTLLAAVGSSRPWTAIPGDAPSAVRLGPASRHQGDHRMSESTALVVIPTTGSPELGDAVRSVLAQTHAATELWVVIDGPEFAARAKEIIAPYEAADPRISSLVLPANTGANGWNGHRIYAAVSFLFNHDYILYLDQDNWFEPDHVASLVDACETNGWQWCHSLRKIYDTAGNYVCDDDCESLGQYPVYFSDEHHLVDTSTYCLRRAVAVALGPDWFGPRQTDRRFYAALAECVPNFGCTGRSTLCYRLGGSPASVTADFFHSGNAVMRQRYPEGFPWRT